MNMHVWVIGIGRITVSVFHVCEADDQMTLSSCVATVAVILARMSGQMQMLIRHLMRVTV